MKKFVFPLLTQDSEACNQKSVQNILDTPGVMGFRDIKVRPPNRVPDIKFQVYCHTSDKNTDIITTAILSLRANSTLHSK